MSLVRTSKMQSMFPLLPFFGQIVIILLNIGVLFTALHQYSYAQYPKKQVLFSVIILTFCCALAVFGLIPLATHFVRFKKGSFLFTYDPWLLASGISCLTLPSIRARRSFFLKIVAIGVTGLAIVDLFLNWVND